MIALMAGTQADSRRMVQTFCASVLGISISLGAIQKIVDRVSAATMPHYARIGAAARQAKVNHADETSWRRKGDLKWLWVLANDETAFFRIDEHRNREAFKSLVGEWEGILVSDGYGLYRKWAGQRQTCLAHLVRAAQGLAESKNNDVARCGAWAKKELQRLCHMATKPPTVGQWNTFYARLRRLIALYRDRKDKAGTFAKRLEREMDSLWVFLHEAGVSPTNNHAERMIRFAVQWRKSSLGTASEKGERWVERILTLRQTVTAQTTAPCKGVGSLA
jgi:transposase